MTEQYEVVIVGGGAVGASAALAIGQCQRRVLLLEKRPLSSIRPTVGLHEKTLALSYSSIKIYEALGLHSLLLNKNTPIKRVQITQQGQFGSCYLDHRAQDVDALGGVIGAHDLEYALYQAIERCNTVTIKQVNSCVEPQLFRDYWEIENSRARLLIAADGADSFLRNKVFIQNEEIDYQHCAIALNIKLKNMQPHLAVERFLGKGAIALLPWQQGWCTCVWTLEKDLASSMMALEEKAFQYECEKVLGKSYSTIIEMSQRMMYPLKMKLAKNQISARFLLLGNAAHSLHPIAAQGLNLSLRDIWELRTQLRQDYSNLIDMGSYDFLKAYDKNRKADQTNVIFATNKIAKVMANDAVPAVCRAMGITLFDMLSFLKHPFTSKSMGLTA